MGNGPLVSVCMPAYNYAALLPQAIESVLGQSYRHFELIVLDDGSTDESLAIARSYASSDSRVTVLTHSGAAHRGINPTLNALLSMARGTYISQLAADDILLDGSIGLRVDALEANPDAGLAYGLTEILDADGRSTGRRGGLSPAAVCAHDRTSDPFVSLLLHDFIPAPSVLIRRAVMQEVGSFDETVYYSDWELWIRIFAHRRLAFLPVPLAGHRVHGQALTPEYAEADLPRRLGLYRCIDEKASAVGGRLAEPRIRALISLQHALTAARLGQIEDAKVRLLTALDVDRSLYADVEFLFWWLGPVQRLRVPLQTDRYTAGWRAAYRRSTADATQVMEGGVGERLFGFWAVNVLRERIPSATAEQLCWMLVANEVEADASRRWDIGILRSSLKRAVRDPRLLRERGFVKILLCAAGVWEISLRIRALLDGRTS